MTPFLKQIARHYCAQGQDASRMVFVFPSQRAAVFFRKYFAEAVAESGKMTVIAPLLYSIEDFFYELDGMRKSDRLSLVLRLYDCYKAVCVEEGTSCESLDDFVFWGDVILKDFDDVDKYLIDARDIFRNVSDLKSLSDNLDYLSDNQKNALESFLGNFLDREEGRLRDRKEYKLRFAGLWNMLGRLYEDFNAGLDADGLCYEGKLYRHIASRVAAEGGLAVFKSAFPNADKVVFCGLNVLSECEKKILDSLNRLGVAEFCWDWCSEWIRNPLNKSSLFMKENVQAFPQAFPLEKCVEPEIEVIKVPSGVAQTKVVSAFLSERDVPVDERTAVILPDETLLPVMLNSIPERVKEVNVTMGYSMASSSFYTLMNDISLLQLRLRRKADTWAFYHKPFWDIVDNKLFSSILDASSGEAVGRIREKRNYFIPEDEIKGCPVLEKVFRPVIKDVKSADGSQIRSLEDYQLEILQFIGESIASNDELKERFSLEMDFAMEYVKAVNLVSAHGLEVLPQTYFRLLDNILRSRSVPIKGEPLTGLQIMGPLETRALDFDRIFILNCNEGVFPRSSAVASFIPPLLRQGFGLPSFEYEDAMWAYYFYRMIQRPSKVYMLMDSRSEGMRSGEESRYVKQLRFHFGALMKDRVAVAVPRAVDDSGVVSKSAEHINIIHSKPLSASALQQYLACSLKFYYSFVLGMGQDEEISESMDAGVIGTVYHESMQELYGRYKDGVVTRAALAAQKKDETGIGNVVRSHILSLMHCDEITGRDIVIYAVICKWVVKTIERDLEFMDRESVDSFRIISLEQKYKAEFGGFRFKGFVDRIDSFHPGVIRVVDYKTGKVLPEDTGITDLNAAAIAEKIFKPGKESDRPKIALQFYIYDMILDKEGVTKGNTVINTVYSTRSLMKDLPVNQYRNDAFCTQMEDRLKKCLEELDNIEVPFVRRKLDFNDKTCEYCDFKNICGR